MAHFEVKHQHQRSLKAASDTNPRRPVRLSASQANEFVTVGTVNVRPAGLTGEATVLRGEHGAVFEAENIVKAVAAASLGPNTEVAVGSTNGRLVPLSVASGVAAWAIGISTSPALDGETFALQIRPRLTGVFYT